MHMHMHHTTRLLQPNSLTIRVCNKFPKYNVSHPNFVCPFTIILDTVIFHTRKR